MASTVVSVRRARCAFDARPPRPPGLRRRGTDLIHRGKLSARSRRAHHPSSLLPTSRHYTKAIESRKALLCVLAQDCDQADYTKLIQALCNEVNVHLIRSPRR